MRSYEVLRESIDEIGAKSLANALRVSPALVYKWCQESPRDDPDASGARNPLDRLADIVRATGSTDVVNWLCHEAGGFFVSSPSPPPSDVQTELLMTTQRLVQEFSHLLTTVMKSIEDDGKIEPSEADRIRSSWEQLKGSAEAFTVACEQGLYWPRQTGTDK
ncbi:MAG: hypothetical protein GY842_09100 [bacterium]|nr:hypothetical protein [bacterium]